MSINDLELTTYFLSIKNNLYGNKNPDSEDTQRTGCDELAGKGHGAELMRRLKAIEIAAQLAQGRLGELK